MNKTLLYITIGVLAIASIIALAIYNQKKLYSNLPPKVTCESYEVAFRTASQEAPLVYSVLNTGSMYPYLPKIQGADPYKTIVAIAVPSKETYFDLKTGKLAVYRNKQGVLVIHSCAGKDKDGWIMSGVNNSISDILDRVTEKNFVCIVSKVYVWTK